jgi:hypothetical protein
LTNFVNATIAGNLLAGTHFEKLAARVARLLDES